MGRADRHHPSRLRHQVSPFGRFRSSDSLLSLPHSEKDKALVFAVGCNMAGRIALIGLIGARARIDSSGRGDVAHAAPPPFWAVWTFRVTASSGTTNITDQTPRMLSITFCFEKWPFVRKHIHPSRPRRWRRTPRGVIILSDGAPAPCPGAPPCSGSSPSAPSRRLPRPL